MKRLTERDEFGNADIIALSDAMQALYVGLSFSETNAVTEALNRLAAYEDTGLEPEEVKAAKAISERIATADYPHNFQRERSDIAAYMRWITDVMRDAKAWWNGRILTRAEAEAALRGGAEG